ncbi:MAG: pantetheine-phosphate adenylyltransferase [Defluviitaleaceae bacterium]|nr:pantetheine-phosphate adenylyltransferase [Defluviitaleaceae bacterium]
MIIVYPGSFDPITRGHVDIALRGARLASKLIIAVLDNPNKKSLFSVEERLKMLENEFAATSNIQIGAFSGLLAEYAQQQNADAILRGLRNQADFAAESSYATYNFNLSGGIDTIFIQAAPEYAYISSSIIREVASHDPNQQALCNMITKPVHEALKLKYKR